MVDKSLVQESATKAIQERLEKEINQVETDQHGLKIHEDMINFKCNQGDLKFIHKTICMVLERGLVPEPEIPPVFTLLEMLGEREEKVFETGHLFLPVNYFVGMWHALNTARKFGLYAIVKTKGKSKAKIARRNVESSYNCRYLDKITMKVAESIDKYHKVKQHERQEDKLKSLAPKNYYVDAPGVAKKINQLEDKRENKEVKK